MTLPERLKKNIFRKCTDHISYYKFDEYTVEYDPVSYEYNEELTHDNPYTVKTPRFVLSGESITPMGGVVNDNIIEPLDDDGRKLRIKGETPADGTVVVVKLINGYYNAFTHAQLKRREQRKENIERYKQAVKDLDEQKKRQKEQERLEDCKTFWEQYDIPVDYKLAINLRKSGLRRGSSGTGRARDTVNHLKVFESFEDRRLKREKGEYMCKGSSSRTDTVTSLNYTTSDAEDYPKKVTCNTCLKRMERWK